jgi:hypothetical protein
MRRILFLMIAAICSTLIFPIPATAKYPYFQGKGISSPVLQVATKSRIPGGGVTGVLTKKPNVKAGTTLHCIGKDYHVTTGSGHGTCQVKQGEGIFCEDGGNYAAANCGSGCGDTSGSGDCTRK